MLQEGKQRHYELGQWFRNRYNGFLPETYSEDDIYVRSTNVDRTLMSGQANLAGLYPPNENQMWEDGLSWQPIPVHTMPEDEDDIVAMHKSCPKYDKLKQDLLNSDYVNNLLKANQDLLDLVTEKGGQDCKTLVDVEYFHDTLKIEKEYYNMKLPDWTNSIYPSRTEPLAVISFTTGAFTEQMARLKTGPFFNHLLTHFRNVIAKNESAQKFLMFPAHDTTVTNLLMAMQSFDYKLAPYAATLIFEVRRADNVEYVNVIYKKDGELINLKVRGCQWNCPFEDFVKALEPVTVPPEQWKEECKV